MNRNQLCQLYEAYRSQGHAVFAVTLATFVNSSHFPDPDPPMPKYWNRDFIYRVKTCLPMTAKIDHDYVVEVSPEGCYHFHGFLAVEGKHRGKLWKDSHVVGVPSHLCSKLKRALDSHSESGKYRSFCVNSHLIEPVNDVTAWAKYITKQQSQTV